MSGRRSERLMNLLIMLLVQDRHVPKERIREVLYGDQTVDAFDRMFDRDKEELRGLGVPIEVGQLDAFFDDEVGYRIRPDHFALPGIRFTADEAAVVSLAGKVWQHASLAEETAAALRKLQPVLDDAPQPLPALAQAQINAEEPSFDVFWQATQERRVVTFDYRRPGDATPTRRRLEPWGVVRQSGRWYVVGRDVDRDEERVFRLSRVVGQARAGRAEGAYVVPPGTDLHEVTRRLAPAPETVTAQLLVRRDAAVGLRRRGKTLESDVVGPDGTDGWDRIEVTGGLRPLSNEVLVHGDNAYVEAPERLRRVVVDRLTGLVGRSAR